MIGIAIIVAILACFKTGRRILKWAAIALAACLLFALVAVGVTSIGTAEPAIPWLSVLFFVVITGIFTVLWRLVLRRS